MVCMMIYNTLTKTKETLAKPRLRMYVCGPTPYDMAHIGHARTAVFFDVFRRYLEAKGVTVFFISNITDVDDKIIDRAVERGVPPLELSAKYTEEYFKDMNNLKVKMPSIVPKVSNHIDIIIDFIQRLIEKGHAYAGRRGVYFSVSSFPEYGKLSGRKMDEAPEGDDDDKKDPRDFALWKIKDDEPIGWDSPWGKGRPGWHIECSAMSMHYLGETMDIHGGGSDLKFPHHENEIAQSEALSGKPFANIWMHTGMVMIDREKMSKSLGNIFTIREALKKYSPEVLRFFLLMTHYRKPLDFSEEGIKNAQETLNYIINTVENLKEGAGEVDVAGAINRVNEAMEDDVNTREALTAVIQLCREVNRQDGLKKEVIEDVRNFFGFVDDVFRILPESGEDNVNLDAIMKILIEIRNDLRKQKNYALADRIRDSLVNAGVELQDSKEGTTYRLVR